MGALCEDAIAASMRAMAEEPKAAEKTKNIECEIDHAEREIEALTKRNNAGGFWKRRSGCARK